MRTPATIAHQLPGRIRLAIPSQRGNAPFFDQLCEHFSGVPGVRRARANPTAATLVLEYDGALEELMNRSGVSNILALGPPADAFATRYGLPQPRQHKPVNLVSGRALDPMFMTGTGFGLIALLQTLRGQVFVPAATAFWYSVATFQQSRMLKLEEVEAGGNRS